MSSIYFKESGFLSKEGESLLTNFKSSIEMLFDTDEVQELTEAEIRILGSNLLNMVSDKVSRYLAFKKRRATQFDELTDQQFEDYLKEKYGDLWILMSLTEDELARCPVLTKAEIKKAIEEGMNDRAACMAAAPPMPIDSSKRFR